MSITVLPRPTTFLISSVVPRALVIIIFIVVTIYAFLLRWSSNDSRTHHYFSNFCGKSTQVPANVQFVLLHSSKLPTVRNIAWRHGRIPALLSLEFRVKPQISQSVVSINLLNAKTSPHLRYYTTINVKATKCQRKVRANEFCKTWRFSMVVFFNFYKLVRCLLLSNLWHLTLLLPLFCSNQLSVNSSTSPPSQPRIFSNHINFAL